MRLLLGIMTIGAVLCLAIAWWTAQANDRNASQLGRLEQHWNALTHEERQARRAQGLRPSWEMTDSQLIRAVGPAHAQRFRHRHPVAR